MPRVSVLLPVHNGAAYLEQAIASILTQSLEDFEFLVINDGSEDRSAAIAEEFALKDDRVRVFHQPKSGLVATLNSGLQLANAPLVARMDADDISHPNRLRRQAEFLDVNSDCVAVGTFTTIVDQDGLEIRTGRYATGAAVRSAMKEGSALAHPTVMYRRKAVLRVGAYRDALRHAEDYDLWLRLLDVGEIDNIAEPLLQYRQHANQVSARRAAEQAASTVFAQELQAVREAFSKEPNLNWNAPVAVEEISRVDLPPAAIARIQLAWLHRAIREHSENGPQIARVLQALRAAETVKLVDARSQCLILLSTFGLLRSRRLADACWMFAKSIRGNPASFTKAALGLLHERSRDGGKYGKRDRLESRMSPQA